VNKKIVLIGTAIGALASTAALAAPYRGSSAGYDSGTYLGASAGQLQYNEEGLGQMTPTILMLRIGQQFSPYLAIEGRIGTNVSGGSAYGYHVNAQAIYAGYVKGMLPLSPWVSGYALAGLGGAAWHRNYTDYNSNDIALSFGVGAEFYLGGNASVNVEWARLTSGSNDHGQYGYSANELTFGVNWRL
jgi:hypothetical protein